MAVPQYLGVVAAASLSVAGGLTLGWDAAACSNVKDGTLRWDRTDKLLMVCDGGEETWLPVYEPPPAAPASRRTARTSVRSCSRVPGALVASARTASSAI